MWECIIRDTVYTSLSKIELNVDGSSRGHLYTAITSTKSTRSHGWRGQSYSRHG